MDASFARPGGRGSRNERRGMWFGVFVYLLSATIAGSLTGLVLASVGGGASRNGSGTGGRLLLAFLSILILFSAWQQWRGRVSPLPERHAQVPRRWLLWPSPVLTAAAFGLVLGAGVFTYLHHASAYALGSLLIMAPSKPAGVAIGAVYGSTWGLVLVAQKLRAERCSSYEDPLLRSTYGKKTLRTLSLVTVGCLCLAFPFNGLI